MSRVSTCSTKIREWAKLRRPGAVEFAHRRLGGLSNALGDKTYLTAIASPPATFMMTTVLRIMPELTNEHANLAAFVKRCTAAPAFQRAYDAQIGDFKQAA